MALTGLLYSIVDSAILIDRGRKGFTIAGDEHNGRINYEQGLSGGTAASFVGLAEGSGALSVFQEASNRRFASTAEPQTLILAELTFLQQEFQFCNVADAVHRRMAMQ